MSHPKPISAVYHPTNVARSGFFDPHTKKTPRREQRHTKITTFAMVKVRLPDFMEQYAPPLYSHIGGGNLLIFSKLQAGNVATTPNQRRCVSYCAVYYQMVGHALRTNFAEIYTL